MTRPREMYAIYRIMSYLPDQNSHQDLTTAIDYTALSSAEKVYVARVKVELFNSQNGIEELAEMCAAAEHNSIIKVGIKRGGAAFRQVISITNETKHNDERIDYHHVLVAEFSTNVFYVLEQSNEIVTTVDWSIDFDGDNVEGTVVKPPEE